jgi:hypothetical protein
MQRLLKDDEIEAVTGGGDWSGKGGFGVSTSGGNITIENSLITAKGSAGIYVNKNRLKN